MRGLRSTYAPLCALMSLFAGILFSSEALPPQAASLLKQAGETAGERERLALLLKLEQVPGLPPSLRRDCRAMIRAVTRWITEKRLPYFGTTVSRTLDYPFGIKPDSPLYPLTCLYRGRMLAWVTLESGNILHNEKRKRLFLEKARKEFLTFKAAFPGNPIARMYLGERLSWPLALPGGTSAPPWARLMRENLTRLSFIVKWWIRNRMQEDGQYGGGWGDDCEMWRWWVPVLVAWRDPEITAAQRRFSEALFREPHMRMGYTSRMSDVEHTAEDSADAITPMMFLAPEDKAWQARALKLASFMKEKWTGRNARGFLQFKSTYFTAERVDLDPRRACDTVYHARAVQPALLLWQRTADRSLGALFTEWLRTWVDVSLRGERGKPPGIMPSAIHWPEGIPGGLRPPWYDPRNHSEPSLYRWPSAMSLLLNALLLAYHMSGDSTFLRPLRSMARLRLSYLEKRPRREPPAGSAQWCAAQMGFLAGPLGKYRVLTGTKEFDTLLARDRPYLLGAKGKERRLVEELLRSAQALRCNLPGYTSEVRYTDRVLRFPSLFGPGMMFKEQVPGIYRPNPQLLYSLATGDPGDCGYFPLQAVRWLTPPEDIAARVIERTGTSFRAELYHFGNAARPMAAELYLLQRGTYIVRVEYKDGTPAARPEKLEIRGPRERHSFTLPPRKLCVLTVSPAGG